MSRSAELVKSYEVRKDGPMVLIIPKPIRNEFGIKKGTKYLVKADSNGKITYRPI